MCENIKSETINECLGLHKHKKNTHKVKLDVIAVVSNPVRFERRYKLFKEFCARMEQNPEIRLLKVELQQRSRPFVTNAQVRLKTKDELWYKENLINIGVQNLPSDLEYMAWIDTDLEFGNENWAQDTIEQLQTYDIVQMFSHAIDLGPNGETLQTHVGFAYQYVNGEEWKPANYGGKFFHPGYAWACRRSAYNDIGGLMEFPILGSADHHMALSFIGLVDKSLNSKLHKNYKELCIIFQERCEKHIKRNIGFVHGTILHKWHSCKSMRSYQNRWKILIDNNFDPLRDIKKDCNNLWQLEDSKITLRDQLRMYFRSRHEDSIDLHQNYQFVKKDWI